MIALVLTVALFTVVVAASVVLVVRTAMRARITDDGDIPDPLDDYVRSARDSVAESREGIARLARGTGPVVAANDSAPTVRFHSGRG